MYIGQIPALTVQRIWKTDWKKRHERASIKSISKSYQHSASSEVILQLERCCHLQLWEAGCWEKSSPGPQTVAERMKVGAVSLHLGLVLGLECQAQYTVLWPLLLVTAHLASYSHSLQLFQGKPGNSVPRQILRVCTMLYFVKIKSWNCEFSLWI